MPFPLGSEITFKHRGSTRTGRIMGCEEVAGDWRRRAGWHYVIDIPGEPSIDVHHDEVGGLVEQSELVVA